MKGKNQDISSSSYLPLLEEQLEYRGDRIFAPVCTLLPPEQVPQLKDQIRLYVEKVHQALRHNEFLDVATVERVAALLSNLLDNYEAYSEAYQALIAGATRYFVQAEDAEPDTISTTRLYHEKNEIEALYKQRQACRNRPSASHPNCMQRLNREGTCMTETSETPSPLQLRAELEKMVRRDLLGPAGGPDEEVAERNMRGRYIVGLLAPRGQSLLPDEQDDLPVDGAGDSKDGKTDLVVPQTASLLPSSISLTFSVDDTAESIVVVARWGYYRRLVIEILLGDKGDPYLVWKRQPAEAVLEPIALKAGILGPWFPDPDNEEVYVRGLCRQ